MIEVVVTWICADDDDEDEADGVFFFDRDADEAALAAATLCCPLAMVAFPPEPVNGDADDAVEAATEAEAASSASKTPVRIGTMERRPIAQCALDARPQ